MTLSRAEVGAEAFPLAMRLGRPRIWPALPPHDGISFDAATGLVTIKAPGGAPVVTPLASAFTFTGGNQGYYRNAAGLLVQGATNTPRIEYGSNGALLGLLLEASRTNVARNSADLSAGTWTKSNCSISTGAAADGTTRNVRIVEDNASAIHGVIAGMTITANTTYCLSAIVEPAGRQFAFMYGINTDQFGALFDFVNLTSAQIIAGTSTINQRGIVPWGNGKYLIWVSGVLNAASTTLNFVGGPATSLSVPAGYTYAGDGASGIKMEFIQVEQGAFPSSRILTAGSSVARTADSCIRTLASEFSATAGSVVVAGVTQPGPDAAFGQSIWALSDGTTNERFNLIRVAGATSLDHRVVDGGVLQNTGTDVVITNSARFKSAMAWAANDLAASFNGAAALTDASMTLPTVTQCELGTVAGASTGNCHIRAFDYYPTRLANTVLQQLSA